MKTHFDVSMRDIFKRLHLEESRISDLELKTRPLDSLTKDVVIAKGDINQLKQYTSANRINGIFIERYVPLICHLAVSEALNSVIGKHF